MISYFISYFSDRGIQNCQLTLTSPISGESKIKEIEKIIEKDYGINQVQILYWKKFESTSCMECGRIK